MRDLIPYGEPSAITSRGLKEETCAKWGYTVSEMAGKKCQVANYRDPVTGEIVAQKVRFKDKQFKFIGDTKDAGLYGQHLWRDGGKMVVVTEGEIDALSVSQLQDNKWPVVSVPNGAQGAKKSLQKAYEWLDRFDSIILMFDNDEPGNKAAIECAEIFAPGKAKIARLPLKDANEMLLEGRGKEVINAIWEAKPYRPDGIVDGRDLLDLVMQPDAYTGVDLPWSKLDEMLMGIRTTEVITITAGSGVGKTAVTTELAYWLGVVKKQKVGLLKLEEPIKRSALGIMGIHVNKPIYMQRPTDPPMLTPEEKVAAFNMTLGNGCFYLYDHFGSTEIENLIAKMRFMAKGLECKWIILDHLSIVISGQDDGDERRLIDNVMTALATFALENDVGVIIVSHLKRPNGDKGHEQGAETSLAQLRGSHAIAQLSHTVVGLERNQQDERFKDITTMRVLKCRFTGRTGLAGWLEYNHDTGRLTELTDDPFERFGDGATHVDDADNKDF